MQKFTLWFGIVLLVIGVLGFVPGVTTDGSLLGIFDVDALHNVVHVLTGVIAIVVAKKSMDASRMFLKVFGVVYGLVAIVGFAQGDTVLGLFGVNMADNVLHLVIAVLALWLGFKKDGSAAPAAPAAPQM
ncbi:MAG: DUF4383 domain-containing protein [Candidatus Paceibacterota bacterium]|jgi:hypothetical protein